jgi:hypothetical protein
VAATASTIASRLIRAGRPGGRFVAGSSGVRVMPRTLGRDRSLFRCRREALARILEEV